MTRPLKCLRAASIHIVSVTYDSKAVSEELLGGGGHGASGGRFCLRTAAQVTD